MSDQNLYTNRLIREKSPYLLQHAHNPVDWYTWGQEAFDVARSLNKPIFLSIGYATCHWCHVMEKESFENIEIANLMNENFINIKVDREELPEVDGLYMEFAQSMMAGAVGWPLNLILTPDLKPFFAATYLPPSTRHGLTGLIDLFEKINEVWISEDRERVIEQAEKIVEAFAENIHVSGDKIPAKEQIENAGELLFKMADPVYGGIKGVPKFPIGYQWNFMMQYASLIQDSRSLFLAERTLDMMYRGGIFDHLGGGFSRYSVDERWLVPHFEKMLYDNAFLAYSYLEAWRITKRPFYKEICEDILNYVIRDMMHSEGGFYSAEDADSEGHEGYFYTWTYDEVRNTLGKEESNLFCEFYQITHDGNFEGRNILHTPFSMEDFAMKKGRDPQDLKTLFTAQKQILWKVRERRAHPFKDDKILSSWNGLMIFSMCEAGFTLGNKAYLDAAVQAANFICTNMWKDGQLFRRWREGQALFSAGLEDYACLIRGFISLFEAEQGTKWLELSMVMADVLLQHFKAEQGAFYQTDGKDSNIILRKCQFSDGAEPSGNAIHCENLLRLYQLTFDSKYLDQAEDIFKATEGSMKNYPLGYCYHLLNLMRYYDQTAFTAVIALNKTEQYRDELRQIFSETYFSHGSMIWRTEKDENLYKILPFLKDQGPIQGKTTLYLCHQGKCLKPLIDLSEMKVAINKSSLIFHKTA